MTYEQRTETAAPYLPAGRLESPRRGTFGFDNQENISQKNEFKNSRTPITLPFMGKPACWTRQGLGMG